MGRIDPEKTDAVGGDALGVLPSAHGHGLMLPQVTILEANIGKSLISIRGKLRYRKPDLRQVLLEAAVKANVVIVI